MTNAPPAATEKSQSWLTVLLAGLAFFMAIYAGCYVAMVEPAGYLSLSYPPTIEFEARYVNPFRRAKNLPGGSEAWAKAVFAPIHWVDRHVRTRQWQSRHAPVR